VSTDILAGPNRPSCPSHKPPETGRQGYPILAHRGGVVCGRADRSDEAVHVSDPRATDAPDPRGRRAGPCSLPTRPTLAADVLGPRGRRVLDLPESRYLSDPRARFGGRDVHPVAYATWHSDLGLRPAETARIRG